MDNDMDLTEKYFDQKFETTDSNIKAVDDKVNKVVVTVEKIDGKVAEHGVRLSLVEQSQKDHINNHTNNKEDKKWNIEMKIIITIFALGQLMAIIDRFFPPSP